MTTENYIFTIDPVPMQGREHNKLYPFYEALKEGRLTTTSCPACEKVVWPPRQTCPACWSDKVEWVDLPTTGSIISYTVQEAGFPIGYTGPLIFALVKVGPVKFATRLVDTDRSDVRKGAPVELAVTEVVSPNLPGEARVLPTFKISKK
jgi:uncharacterized OB-fold protein